MVDAEEAKKLCDKLMTEQVVEPFIAMLSMIIEKGCDPHAQVQKLKRIRELEARKLEL